MAAILGVIPARYASTRFPGKPLADIGGMSMIERVWRRASAARCISTLIIATDDERILEHCSGFGARVMMTSAVHPTGTDRCAEVLQNTQGDFSALINIQGDEPFIDPASIDALGDCILQEGADIATLVTPLRYTEELRSANTVKVVCDRKGKALYFSRQAIPHVRGLVIDEWLSVQKYYRHIGLYAYRSTVLPLLGAMGQSELEKAESLEQLRWLENGLTVYTRSVDSHSISVDTPDDLDRARESFNRL